jgi:hypothetical protein
MRCESNVVGGPKIGKVKQTLGSANCEHFQGATNRYFSDRWLAEVLAFVESAKFRVARTLVTLLFVRNHGQEKLLQSLAV